MSKFPSVKQKPVLIWIIKICCGGLNENAYHKLIYIYIVDLQSIEMFEGDKVWPVGVHVSLG